jgi:hypothetical protein
VRLNVAAAFSFSECTRTIVASTSSTIMSSGRAVPATVEAGTPAGIRSHTRALVFALAFATRFNTAGVSSSKARHAVGGDATGPSTACWWRRVSMSAMASPPAVTIVARSTRTRPRSCPGTNPRRVVALDR